MSGPWEDFKPTGRPSTEDGPWADFAPTEASASSTVPNILQEQHPGFDYFADRFAVKNFGTDDKAAVDYLQKRHPDLQVGYDTVKKQIVAKRPEEAEWRVLDPDTGFFSRDFFRDAGDLTYDTLAGFGTSAATAAGGIAGGLPGAAGAGAVSSSALEALRQAVGQGIGVSNDFDKGNLVGAAATGAISPFVFGTGAAPAQAVLKAEGKTLAAMNPFAGLKEGLKGITKTELDDAGKAVFDTQRGIPGRLWDGTFAKFGPALGEWASGIHRDVISTFAKDPAKIEAMGEQTAKDLVRAMSDEATGKVKQRYEILGGLLDSVYDLGDQALIGAPEEEIPGLTVSMSHVLEPLAKLKDQISANKAGGLDTAATESELQTIEGILSHYFNGGQLQDLPASLGFRLKKQLDNLADYSSKPGAFGHEMGNKPMASQEVTQAIREVQGRINDELVKVTGNAMKANPQALAAFPQLAENPQILRTLNDHWSEMRGEVQPFVRDLFKNDHAAFRNLTNLPNRGNITKYETAQQLDNLLGTNIAGGAKELAAVKAFTNPPWMASSSMGTTSTSRTSAMSDILEGAGYWAGAQSGLGQGGAGVGKMAAGMLGSTIGSPAALKTYMKANAKGRNLNRALLNSGTRPLQQVLPWIYMQNRQQPE